MSARRSNPQSYAISVPAPVRKVIAKPEPPSQPGRPLLPRERYLQEHGDNADYDALGKSAKRELLLAYEKDKSLYGQELANYFTSDEYLAYVAAREAAQKAQVIWDERFQEEVLVSASASDKTAFSLSVVEHAKLLGREAHKAVSQASLQGMQTGEVAYFSKRRLAAARYAQNEAYMTEIFNRECDDIEPSLPHPDDISNLGQLVMEHIEQTEEEIQALEAENAATLAGMRHDSSLWITEINHCKRKKLSHAGPHSGATCLYSSSSVWPQYRRVVPGDDMLGAPGDVDSSLRIYFRL